VEIAAIQEEKSATNRYNSPDYDNRDKVTLHEGQKGSPLLFVECRIRDLFVEKIQREYRKRQNEDVNKKLSDRHPSSRRKGACTIESLTI